MREREREDEEGGREKEKGKSFILPFLLLFPITIFSGFLEKRKSKERHREKKKRAKRDRNIKRLNSASKSWKPESGISTN